jgi:hypothetical protein
MRSKSVEFLEVLSYGGLEGNFKGGHLFLAASSYR